MTERLAPGDVAPDFELPCADGTTVALRDFPGQSVIVYFYPAAMTPGCTIQAVDFSQAATELSKAGYQVLGISPDSAEKLVKFADKENLGIRLLADPERAVLSAWSAFGEKMLYGKTVEGVIRSTFVVDVDEAGKGVIRVAQYNVKATGHVARLRRELGIEG